MIWNSFCAVTMFAVVCLTVAKNHIGGLFAEPACKPQAAAHRPLPHFDHTAIVSQASGAAL